MNRGIYLCVNPLLLDAVYNLVTSSCFCWLKLIWDKQGWRYYSTYDSFHPLVHCRNIGKLALALYLPIKNKVNCIWFVVLKPREESYDACLQYEIPWNTSNNLTGSEPNPVFASVTWCLHYVWMVVYMCNSWIFPAWSLHIHLNFSLIFVRW